MRRLGFKLVLGAVVIGSAIAAVGFANDRIVTDRLLRADPDRIAQDHSLFVSAVIKGSGVYADHCASCHGPAGKGDSQSAVPDLTDSDWLYGAGTPGEIEKIAAHGIRAHNSRTWNLAEMPAYGRSRPLHTNPDIKPLTPGEIRDVAEFVGSLDGHAPDAAARARGAAIFQGKAGCNDCHGADARGDAAIGAPNLTDNVWLYLDGSREAIHRTIALGLEGVCPGGAGKLDAASIRAVAVYVYSLSHRAASRTSGMQHASSPGRDS
jgi:cytochrome c oxidase cbb3-type subunit 3